MKFNNNIIQFSMNLNMLYSKLINYYNCSSTKQDYITLPFWHFPLPLHFPSHRHEFWSVDYHTETHSMEAWHLILWDPNILKQWHIN